MANVTTVMPTINTILLILVIAFTFSGAQNTTVYFKGLDAINLDKLIGVTTTTDDSVKNSSSNPYAKYIFGLPPIPVDPSIPWVETDDDFETLAPIPRDLVYNEEWFVSGFDTENRPIVVKTQPRVGASALKLLSNSTLRELILKLERYRFYIITKAMKIRSTKEKPVTQFVFVNDFIHANSYAPFLTKPAGIKWFIHNAANQRQFFEKYQKTEIVVNVGVVGELAIRLFARVGTRRHLQVYGPDKATWIQALRKQFPRDQLPESHGGFKGHVPLKLYPD